jgi:hypothetical protein
MPEVELKTGVWSWAGLDTGVKLEEKISDAPRLVRRFGKDGIVFTFSPLFTRSTFPGVLGGDLPVELPELRALGIPVALARVLKLLLIDSPVALLVGKRRRSRA